MTVLSDLVACDGACGGEQGVGFRSPFDGTRFDASGSLTDAPLGDEDKEVVEHVVWVDAARGISPVEAELHGVLEADFAGQAAVQFRRLGHHQADQVVGE